MSRRWLYWGLPLLGVGIGLVRVMWRWRRDGWDLSIFDEVIDCVGGAVIWLGITTILRIVQIIAEI